MSLHEKEASDEKRDIESTTYGSYSTRWSRRLLTWGIEGRGTIPVQPEDRTDTQYFKNFFLWFSFNCNILSFSAGSLGLLTTWGPKLGLRQMIQARYSFGYFGVIVPCIFNLIGMCGFCILNCILGGQTLASVAGGHLSWRYACAINSQRGLIAIQCRYRHHLSHIAVSFCGIKVLSWYERVSWVPVVIVFVVALGVGGKHISNVPAAEPATAAAILSFASTIAGFVITYSGLSSDFTIYFRPDTPSMRLFLYSYLGFLLPIVTLQCLGAAVTASAALVPEWEAGYAGGNVGGLLEAMLHPAKGFGKFLTVLMSLSVAGNIAPTFYSFSLNVQVFIPILYLVPRYVFSIIATAVVLPIAIVGAHKFYDTLVNFLGLIGYWASAFVAVILVEHFVFRRNDPSAYDIRSWNKPRELPWGIAALAASIGCFGLVVPCMEQTWFVGPIGKTTGDIGFEVAFFLAGLLYYPLRKLEIKYQGRL
ncbi:hypothetical protein BDZ89DRAFT_1057799 [Hymenopellis radicata]|nr:hypothetical protein BDZ89DRAFT_1057799 [Hymenopellis radicata]